ncbi:hypothetical protein [Rhizobium rhizoryzae]|jgi:hypothetical protein|uniref:DUF541 domain-containing protein n=1 Tax=Rhizobium rhizoryzae TaxID=451876 RepID=A0A7W6LDY9_9HYPH|nr:hypothetical protein [Rhizobium rhizoryzae]MBB4142639.1 hypothetical protein [Rhizobium rhizoryzae]
MYQKLSAFALFIAIATLPNSALSQTIPYNPRALQVPEGHVSINVSLGLSNPIVEGTAVEEQIEAIQKRAYQLAGKQCQIITQSIADSCKLLGITSNINTQRQSPMSQIGITLQVNLAIRFRDEISKP